MKPNVDQKIKVWDPLVRRIVHWLLAIAVGLAFLLEDKWLNIHVMLGYLALGLVAIRLVWGIIGTGYAKFSTFIRPPSEILAYIVDVVAFRAHRHIGHNPAAGAIILALLAMIAFTGLSGLALYGAKEFSGPLAELMLGLGPDAGEWMEEIHEICANLTMLLVGFHVLGVVLARLQHR